VGAEQMPYAEATSVLTHMPSRNYAHYVLVTEAVEVEKRYTDLYDGRNVVYSLIRTIHAGLYGFTNLDARNSFISTLNRSSETEVAFIANIAADIQDPLATGPVVS
jgi:hypothetical protein